MLPEFALCVVIDVTLAHKPEVRSNTQPLSCALAHLTT